MLLVNMNHTRSVETVRRCRWILDAGVFAWQQLDTREGQQASLPAHGGPP